MTQALASADKSPATVAHLVSLLRDFDAATLVTRLRGGSLHGRPMSIARVDDNATLWFITSVASAKVEEVAEDARAMVTAQSGSRFVCLNGSAELVFDPEQIRALWKEQYRVFYQHDRDPDVVLVRFSPLDAEYWDTSGAHGASHLFPGAGGRLSADPLEDQQEPRNDPESHAKLRLWDPVDGS